MNKVMEDSRNITKNEADDLMRAIAELEIEVVKVTAKFERMITDLKSESEFRTKDLADRIAVKAAELKCFIGNNPHEFKKPKARKTPYGKYGKRKVSNLTIDEAADVMKYSDKHGLNLYRLVAKVDKSAVKAAIGEGHRVTGARLIKGEESFYSVEKELIDSARKNVLSS